MPLTSPVNNHSKIDDDLEIEAIVEKSAKLLVEDRFSPVTTHVLVENASSGQNKSESDESSESVSSDEEFYVHKVLRPLRKSKSAINGLSPSVKFPSSTSSFWPYQGIENFFHSPPVLDEMNNVLREKKINTNEVECVDFEENLQNANPPKNTMENVKETDRQTQHECFDASLSYRKEKKYYYESEEEIEETDHHQGSQRSFHTGSCSVMSSEEDEERGDALPISWSDPGLAYLLLDEATDERENPMDNNNGFRGGKILGSRRHPAVEEIGDDDEDNGKRSSWSAPSGLNDLRCARNLISPHSFDVPESPECTDAIRSPQIHEPLVRQNTDYYDAVDCELQQLDSSTANSHQDNSIAEEITNKKFTEIDDEAMSTSSDGLEAEGESDNDDIEKLPEFPRKNKTQWKLILAPSASMVFSQKARRNIPSSVSDSALVWNRSPRLTFPLGTNCIERVGKAEEEMDSTSRGSKITSDSSQLTTNPKFVPRSQTTNNVGGVLQLTDKNETTGRLTEEAPHQDSAAVEEMISRPTQLLNRGGTPRMQTFYGASCVFPMADASYILTNESPIESSMPKNSSSATRVPYLTQIIPTPDQLENNNDDDKERSQKSAIQPKQSTEAFNSRRSPPLAIAEQMSESEISDLERKIAGGEFTESLHIDQMVPFGGKMSNESAFNNNRRTASSWHSDIHTLLQIPDDQQQDFSHLQRGGRMYQSLISSSFEQQKRKRRRLPKLPDEHPADDHMGKSQTDHRHSIEFIKNHQLYEPKSLLSHDSSVIDQKQPMNEEFNDQPTQYPRRALLLEEEGLKFSSSSRPSKYDDLKNSPSIPVLSESMLNSPTFCTMIEFEQSSNNNNNSRPPNDPRDYQLNYGLDSSLNRSIIGYWPSCNDFQGGMRYDEARWPNENLLWGHERPLDDANKSSSGISSSSCCTTLSGEGGNQQQERKPTATAEAMDITEMNPTHRVQFAFVPRHNDELLLEVGDPVHVSERFKDHWHYGFNLRTKQRGIFPSAHICEIDLIEEICNSALPKNGLSPAEPWKHERDTFFLTMLASIEVAHHKGNDVLIQAINKVCSMYQKREEIIVPQTTLLEISYHGIHVIDKRKKDFFRCPTFDFFYSLQNISFCGAHPKELRFFGFITKHPILPRFACHVFLSSQSTQPIVEAIGRAFKRGYDQYMAFQHPTEDLFIE